MTTVGWLIVVTGVTLLYMAIKGQVFDASGKFVLPGNLRTLVDGFIRGDVSAVRDVTGAEGGGTDPVTVEGDVIDTPGTELKQIRKGTWVPGGRISQVFGKKNARYAAGWHTGVDISAREGTPIYWNRPGPGKVSRFVGGAYGKGTIIDDGANEWLFGHQSARSVSVGDTVQPGQEIGKVGHTGFTKGASGDHLHLERSRGRKWSYARVVNPL